MLLTIKRPHNIVDSTVLNDFLRQANAVARMAHSIAEKNIRFKKMDIENEIKGRIYKSEKFSLIDSSWIKTIVNNANNLTLKNRKKSNKKGIKSKVLFGNRDLFNKLAENNFKSVEDKEKTKKDYTDSRNGKMVLMRGSTTDSNGNRKCELTWVDDEKTILNVKFKINKDNHFDITLDNIKRKQLKDIRNLIETVNLKQNYFNIGISKDEIFINYDNKRLYEKEENLIEDRTLAIDLNTTEIGYVVMTKNCKIIKEGIFNTKKLVDLRNANKNDYELSLIARNVADTATYYKCSTVTVETLNFNQGKAGRGNNEWNRKDFTQVLEKWCDERGLKYISVNAAYSSFMGQFYYPNKLDSIAAALEIGKRGFINPKEIVERYETFLQTKTSIKQLSNRWKETLSCMVAFKGLEDFNNKYLYTKLKSSNKLYRGIRLRLVQYLSVLNEKSFICDKSLVTSFDVTFHHLE